MKIETKEICEKEKPVSLGDWTEILGADFSGSGIYKTKFKAPHNAQKMCIDLGKVHCSTEVFLNGESLGVCVMSPYVYEVLTDSLKEENTLEIRVTNTSANEYYHTKSFDKWQSWQLTPYDRIQKVFHKDSLSGGLHGPVKIKFN